MRRFVIFSLILVASFLSGCGNDGSKDVTRAFNLLKISKPENLQMHWNEAKEIASKRLAIVPTDIDAAALMSLALFYTEGDKSASVERAINLMKQAATLRPERYDIWFIYGWLLYNNGNYAAAREPLQKAYDLHLETQRTVQQEVQGAIKYTLGCCCIRTNELSEAEKYLLQAVKSTPYSEWSGIYNDLGCIAVYSGNFSKAMAYLNEGRKVENAIKDASRKNKNIHLLDLNTAIVCDYLSYPTFNPKNAASFRAGAKNWYLYARGSLDKARKNSTNASEQVSYAKIIGDIDHRVNTNY